MAKLSNSLPDSTLPLETKSEKEDTRLWHIASFLPICIMIHSAWQREMINEADFPCD